MKTIDDVIWGDSRAVLGRQLAITIARAEAGFYHAQPNKPTLSKHHFPYQHGHGTPGNVLSDNVPGTSLSNMGSGSGPEFDKNDYDEELEIARRLEREREIELEVERRVKAAT